MATAASLGDDNAEFDDNNPCKPSRTSVKSINLKDDDSSNMGTGKDMNRVLTVFGEVDHQKRIFTKLVEERYLTCYM